MPDLEAFLAQVARWAATRGDVVAVTLVGSHARGTAREDSDVDLVILCQDPRPYLEDTGWVEQFGVAPAPEREDYGVVQSLRTTYADGLEVEFGMTGAAWASTEPLDTGTREVVSDGCRIVFDSHGVLAALLRAVEAAGG